MQKVSKDSPERQLVNKKPESGNIGDHHGKEFLVTNKLPKILEFFDERPNENVCIQKYVENPVLYELISFQHEAG